MSRAIALAALCLLIMLVSCGGQSNSVLQPADGATSVDTGTPVQPGSGAVTPAPGAGGSGVALTPPAPTTGLPLPAAAQTQTASSATAAPVGLGGFNLGELPGTVPEKPANWDSIKAKLDARRSGSNKSASDANLFALTPFAPLAISATGQFAPPFGGNCYDYLSSDDPSTPLTLESFNAQHLSVGMNELHVWGSVQSSNVRDMVYAQIGLVPDYTYNFALDPNLDGNPADAVPSYMFNQGVSLMNAINAGTPFASPLDFNGTGGLGFAWGYAPGNAYDFDLRLVPDQAPGGTGGLSWLRIRPRITPYQPWSAYSGMQLNPAAGLPYGTDNWGWRGPEDFTGALILAQIYSYNPSGVTGNITFQYVRATEGPLTVPTVDCRSITNARFLLASPGTDGLQGTPDDVALTGWNSTNAAVNAEPVLLLGDRFYVFFDNDPAQVNDIELYPSIPVAGMVQYTTTGLIADPALATYFDMPDPVPGNPGMVYSAAHPFILLLRNGAYNRIQNDVRSLTWANFQIATNPGFTAITPVRPTSGSNVDRVILAQGVQYTPFFYNLAYTQAGSYPPPGGFGSTERIYPNAHTTGFISVGYGGLTEGGTVLGTYYDQAVLVNTLQADAYCRFETRTNWGAAPLYGMADADLLGWISLPTLDPRSQPWNTAVYARGTNFFLQTTDISVSPAVNVAAGRLLDAGLGAGTVVNFNTVGGAGPYNGSFNVLPVRVYDDPALSDPDANVTRLAGAPPQWDVVVNFLLQYGQAAYTVELDSDWDGAWNSAPAGRIVQVDGDTVAPGVQTFAVGGAAYSRTVRIPNTHPAGGFNFAIRVTDILGAQYTYAWANMVWLMGPPTINMTALSGARFTVHQPSGAVLAANLDTDTNYNGSAVIALGDSFYVDLQLDALASPNDRAVYPARPSVAGVVQYTAQGMVIDPALAPYFGTAQFGYQLLLRPGAYNRITNDVTSLSWANYSLIEDGTGTTIMAARATNTSSVDRVILRANINYRSRFSSLPYATTGSSLRAETIYPLEWNTGYITTGFGTLTEGGTVLSNYFDQAGLANTLQADAFCRFESSTSPGVNYGFNDVATALPILPVVLDPLARPYDVVVLARGTVFSAVDALANTTANVTVGAGHVLNGVTTLNLPLGARTLTLNVLPVRVFDDPALTDPYQNVTQVAGGWNVVLNFLLQYGAANYTVQLDGDYNGTWDSAPADRVYAVPGSPYAAVGAQSSTVNIPSVGQPTGSYTLAIRVTDSSGAQYTYVWPDQVFLPDVRPGDWSMFGREATHNRRSPYVGAQTATLKWAFLTGGRIYSSPALRADGTAYLGSDDHKLYAINPDGTLNWSYTTGDPIYSSPAIGADGTVYVGNTDSGLRYNLYAINPDGTLSWAYATGQPITSPLVIGTDGTIYVGCWDNHLYAINPDGTLKWSTAMWWLINGSSPAIDADGTVYVGDMSNRIYAINPDGSHKWEYMTGDTIGSSPAIGSDGTVYVGSYDSNLYAINPDGSLKWSFSTGNQIQASSPAIGADGTVYIGSGDYSCYAINPDGSLKWSYATGDGIGSSPAIGADGTVYIGSGDNSFYAINIDGTLKWSYLTGGAIGSSPAIGEDGTVYVGSDDGNLYAFGP